MEDEIAVCSAKGCRAPARHVLVWNNPKLHTPDREKTWVACDDHRQSLADHLDVRGFLRRVDPLRTGRWTCPTCGADFPPEQQRCPVCLQHDGGSCGSKD
ncbi:MAG: uncharacterized protein JWN57_1202 [Frankiales bacterium]|nr:uncharacterized protein [Frankiales bacterium]